jgi:hypothetical protein
MNTMNRRLSKLEDRFRPVGWKPRGTLALFDLHRWLQTAHRGRHLSAVPLAKNRQWSAVYTVAAGDGAVCSEGRSMRLDRRAFSIKIQKH